MRAVDQSESGNIFMTMNGQKAETSAEYRCTKLINGITRVLLESHFEAFDEKHLFVQYEIRVQS